MKIGTTSYIYPDNIIPNAEKLCGLVEDLQLILFEGEDYSNLPTVNDIKVLSEITKKSGLSYTVHLPIDLDVCSSEENFRKFSLTRTLEIMELTNPLNPTGFVLHLPRKSVISEGEWQKCASESLSAIYENYPVDSLYVENLSYPISLLEPVINNFNSNLCLDISHAVRCGDDWENYFELYFDRIGVIHFYGPESDSEGHLGLQKADRSFVNSAVKKLVTDGFDGLLILEVFGKEDFFESMTILKEELGKWQKKSL